MARPICRFPFPSYRVRSKASSAEGLADLHEPDRFEVALFVLIWDRAQAKHLTCPSSPHGTSRSTLCPGQTVDFHRSFTVLATSSLSP